MYRDWFVAYVNQMSAEDTGSFLFLTGVLRNASSERSILKSSLGEVGNHLEINLQIYMLPYLAGIAVNKEHALQKDAKGIIRQISSNFQDNVANEVARNIDEPNSVRMQIRKMGMMNPPSVSLSEEDYMTLTESIDAIMCLSALMNYDKDIIHSIAQEELCAEFLMMSSKGFFGRYAMVLAQETCLLSGLASLIEAAKALQRNDRSFYEFPDTIEILLKYYFRGKPAQEILQITCASEKNLFDRFVEKCEENNEFWLSFGLPFIRLKNQYKKQLRILWENIAIYLAIQSAVDEDMLLPAINSIVRYWETQRAVCDKEDLKTAFNSRCPWMFRSFPGYTKARKAAFAEYSQMGSQAVTLKAAVSAPILFMIFSYNNQKLPEFLYELIMNLVDAYSGPGVSYSIEEGYFPGNKNTQERYFSDALISLLAYAKRLVDYIGKGYLDNTVPEQLFLNVIKYSKRVLNGEDMGLSLQRERLHCGPSVMACVSLAYEEASAEFPEVKNGYCWMKGGEDSFAKKLCEIALNDFWNYIRNSPSLYNSSPEGYLRTPIDLAYEHFPGLIEDAGLSGEDWLYEDKKLPQNTQTMLLRSYSADEWEDKNENNNEIKLGDYSVKSIQYSRAFAAIMHRISAILKEKYTINDKEKKIFDSWIEALIKMDTPKSFSRSSRYLAAKVLERLLEADSVNRVNDKRELIEKDAADMMQIVVETVVDLSKQTPFYQYVIAKEIIESKLAYDQPMTDDIIKCIFFSILLSQEKEAEAGNILLTDPYKIKQQKKSGEVRRQIIYWYIGNISERLIDEGDNIRGRLIRMLEKWYQTSGYKKEKVIIGAYSIKIKESAISICGEETDDDIWYEWEPDVLDVWEKSKNLECWEQEVYIKNEKGKYFLLKKGFLEFLLEKGFNDCEPLKVVFRGIEKEGYLFSVNTGNHYCIPSECIDEESLKELQQRIYEYKYKNNKYPKGLYVNVKININTHGRIPQLKIEGFDTRNLDYINLFNDSEYVKPEKPNKLQIVKNGFEVEIATRNPEKYMIIDEEGWNVCAQRCGKVKLREIEKEGLEIPGSDNNIRQRIEYLYGLCESEEHFLEVRLKQKGRAGQRFNNHEYLQGLTREKMPVKIETDSIMFGSYIYPLNHYKSCIVSAHPTIDKRIDIKNKCKGIIWEKSKVMENGKRLIKFRYVHDNKFYDKQVESSSLEEILDIDTIYVGMPIIYDYETKTVTPVFYHPENRLLSAGKYKVRYLWKMKRCKGDNIEDIQSNGHCVNLGIHRIGNGEDVFELIQDFKNGEVYAFERSGIEQEKLDESALKAKVYVYGAGGDLIDIHHLKEADEEFEDAHIVTDIPNRSQRLANLYFEQYMNWKNDRFWIYNNYLHAEGIIIEEKGMRYFEVRKPLKYLPCDGNNVSNEDTDMWTKRIKLADEDEHLVTSSKWAYAKIELSENGSYVADVDHAEPFNWEQFQKWLRNNYRNKRVYEIPLFFRDMKNDNMYFEWGIGRCFIIPQSRLKMAGSGKGMFSQWFYGDKISCFRIEGNGKDAFLAVKMEDYDFSVEHRIKYDAEKNILQYVKVRFEKEKDRIIAEESTVSKPRLSNENYAWSFEKVKAVELTADVENKIKEEIPAGGKGCILVQLDRKNSKKHLIFGLAELKTFKSFILCLKGGEICQEKNDYYVTFSTEVSDCTMIGPDSEISVNVYRRSFSYNESTLRVYYAKDKKAFQKNMFVKVFNDNGTYQGSIKKLFWRPQSVVRDWLRRYGAQDVTAGEKHKSKNIIQVEIKPGVFCGAEFRGKIKEGVTCRLFLRGESVIAEAISYSDDYFLTDGRTVELLMLDSAFGKNMKPKQFTVAGMPQILLGNQELAEKLKNRRPPRYGRISGGALHAAGNVRFGLLKVERDEKSEKEKIIFNRYCKQEGFISFNRISFFDAGIFKIMQHIKRGQWHYHDRFAKVCGYNRPIPYGESGELPVIFDDSWGLRYKEEELEKYIYPPHELEEYGLPEEQYDLDCRYPIAGRTKQGIIVELSPGRIVKIPDSLLYIVDDNKSVGKLCTTYISEGDIVKLSTHVPEPGKPVQIRLEDIEYGLRAFIRNKAFLPVISGKKDCIVAGGGFYQLKYPKNDIKKDILILDKKDNNIIDSEIQPQCGDLVFLELNHENEIKVVGYPSVSVYISKMSIEQKAKGTGWFIKSLLDDDSWKKLFEIMQNRIPMIVDKAEDDEMYVYYPYPSLPEDNTILCCQVIGVLDKSTVCFRSGTLIFAIDIGREITLPKQELAMEVAKRLKPGRKVWIHFVNRSFKIGCYKSQYYGGKNDKRKITIEEVIDCAEGHGFLCRDVSSSEFYWMPVENVCRAEHVLAKEIDEVLFLKRNNRKHLLVEIDNCGYASYLKNNISLSVSFDKLRPDDRDKIIKVVVHSEIKNCTNGRKLYLCRERPMGNIYLLQAELEHKQNEKLDANCVKKGEACAVLMPCSEIRTPIHLSQLLIKAIQQSYRALPGQQNREIKRDKLSGLLEEFRGKNKEFGNNLLCYSNKLVELKEYGDTDSSLIQFRAEISKIIRQFFEKMKNMECGVIHINLMNAIFISAIAQCACEDAWKEAGRKMYSIIQKNMIYYCCEEILLEKWFLYPEYSGIDLRTLLNSVYLGGVELMEDEHEEKITDQKNGTLTVNQVEKIKNACEIILRRNRDIKSDGLVESALCLLEVSGQMKNYPQYNSHLQEIIEKTKCYEALGKGKNTADLVEYILKLCDDNIFNSIGVHEPVDVFEIFNLL